MIAELRDAGMLWCRFGFRCCRGWSSGFDCSFLEIVTGGWSIRVFAIRVFAIRVVKTNENSEQFGSV
jgi:hypothetical protein